MDQARAEWTTSVSVVDEEDVYVRGYALRDLLGTLSFPAACYLLVRGKLPTPAQARMMDCLLCAILDYSLQKPGTVAARYVASANPSMVCGIATAVLATGEYTLSPESAGHFIRDGYAASVAAGKDIAAGAAAHVAELRAGRKRVPGFGHPNFRYSDPRAQKLKGVAQKTGVWGDHCAWYEAVHAAFIAAVGKPEIVINDVGMMAAIMTDMGFSPAEMTGIALISSMPGVVAHLSEELESQVRIRTVSEGRATYDVQRRDLADDMHAAGWD